MSRGRGLVRRYSLVLLVLPAIALLAMSASPAAAQETVAASCSTPPTSSLVAGTGGNERFAQTFSASLSGALTRAEIDVLQAGTAGNYVVQVMGVDPGTGRPNNAVLASTTVPDSMPDQEYLLSATFSAPASIVAGQSYALVITRPGSDTLDTGIRTDCPGEFFYSPAGTTDWQVDAPDEDFVFTAFVKPTNAFTLSAITRNKKKGTATITLNVPNPGDLTGSGNGVKAASAGAVISKSVGAGPAQLLIKAKGKKKKKLNETGKVKLNVAVTYAPTGGDPSTQSVKVKLKKRL